MGTMLEKLRYFFSKKPVTLYFCATERCNSKCLQCNYWSKEHFASKELSLEEIKRIFTDLYNFGVRYVFLAGGEPLLRQDIDEVIKFMDVKGFKIVLSTNGILLNEERIKKLAGCKNLQVVFSLDSVHDKNYALIRGVNSLPKLKENIALTKKYFGAVKVNTVVSELNFSEVGEIMSYCKENDIYVSLYPYNGRYAHYAVNSSSMSYEKHTEDVVSLFKRLAQECQHEHHLAGFSLIYEQAADWLLGKEVGRCSAGRDFLFLDYNGVVRVCFHTLPPLGNLREQSMSEIFSNIDTPLIDACNKKTPCFFGCTRSIAIVRDNKWAFVKEALVTGKITKFLKHF